MSNTTTTAAGAPVGDCLRVLEALAEGGWEATSVQLGSLGMLNERGRISDLRHKHGVEIDAYTRSVDGRRHTTYYVTKSNRAQAARVLSAGRRRRDEISFRRERGRARKAVAR